MGVVKNTPFYLLCQELHGCLPRTWSVRPMLGCGEEEVREGSMIGTIPNGTCFSILILSSIQIFVMMKRATSSVTERHAPVLKYSCCF